MFKVSDSLDDILISLLTQDMFSVLFMWFLHTCIHTCIHRFQSTKTKLPQIKGLPRQKC